MLGSILKDIFLKKKSPVRRPSEIDFLAVDIVQREGGQILWFMVGSEGDALTQHTKEMVALFKGRASRITSVDLRLPDWREKLEEAFAEPVWFALSPFGVGQDLVLTRGGESVNFWEAHGIPFVRLFGDTPAYYPDKHVGQFRNSINAYFNPSHPIFYQRWFSDRALSVLLPPFMIDQIPLEKVDVDLKLQGKIIFTKNGNPPGQLVDYWHMSLPTSIAKILVDMAEESTSSEWINREPCFDDRLVKHFAAIGVNIITEPAVLCFLVAQLDDYLRRIKSTMIAEALLGLPVIIRGRFWEHVDFRGKRVTYDPNSDYAGTQPLIDQAPAIVDMSPNSQHFPHDRIWRAAGRGTAFLTNKLECLNPVLPETDRFSFDFTPDSIRNLVENYVTHPREAIDLGLEQAKALRRYYKEENFVISLLAAVQTCSLRLGGRPPGTQNFIDFPSMKFK